MFEQIYQSLYDQIRNTDLHPWIEEIAQGIRANLCYSSNGHLPRWIQSLEALPQVTPSCLRLDQDAVTIGSPGDLQGDQPQALANALMSLHPWRKGPWNFFGLELDAEWRSNLKWDRLKQAMSPLRDRLVLDIGSGNGYYSYRMAGEQAQLALGIDPYLLYVVQSLVAQLPARYPSCLGCPLFNRAASPCYSRFQHGVFHGCSLSSTVSTRSPTGNPESFGSGRGTRSRDPRGRRARGICPSTEGTIRQNEKHLVYT